MKTPHHQIACAFAIALLLGWDPFSVKQAAFGQDPPASKATQPEKAAALARVQPLWARANALLEQGQMEEAVAVGQSACEQLMHDLPNENGEIESAFLGLARLCERAGRIDEMVAAYDKALPYCERQWGSSKGQVNLRKVRQVETLLKFDRLADAEKRLSDVVADMAQDPGPNFSPYRAALKAKIEVDGALDLWEEAEQACDTSLRIMRQWAGMQHSVLPEVLDQGEKELAGQLAMSLAKRRADTPERAARCAEWALNLKGIYRDVYARSLRGFLSSNDPAEYRLARKWLKTRTELASLLMTPVDPRSSPFERMRVTQRINALSALELDLTRTSGHGRSGHMSSADYAAIKKPWASLDELRKRLPADAVFINFCCYAYCDFNEKKQADRWKRFQCLAFVIPAAGQGDVACVDFGEDLILRNAAYFAWLECRDPTAAANENENDRAIDRLARLLLGPLQPHLGNAKHLIVSPDLDLWQIPWAALPLGQDQLLVEKYRVSYSFGGREFVEDRELLPATRGAVVFGEPDYDWGGKAESRSPKLFRPLPGAAEEVRSIRPSLAAYCGEEPRVLTGDQATCDAFAALRRPGLLVFSTHGFFGDQLIQNGALFKDPFVRSGLALAGANHRRLGLGADRSDGILTSLEVLAADLLGTDLVVLSACETARGKRTLGDGLRGLQQAFHMAGARSVLATQWSIPDRETSQLMGEFFRQLAGGQDKAESLRRAQVHWLESRRKAGESTHPVFWAAFILSGQWRSERPDPTAQPAPNTIAPDEDTDIESIIKTEGPKNSLGRTFTERITYSRLDDHGVPRKLSRHTEFSPEGKLRDTYCYNARGQRHGFKRVYYPTGAIKLERDYEDGRLFDGKRYSEQGQIVSVYWPLINAFKPPDVEVFARVEYRSPITEDCQVTLFLPANSQGPWPIIVAIPGYPHRPEIMWMADALREPEWLGQLAARGYFVASVKYRAAGKAEFPAQLADCKVALRVLRGLPKFGYNVDPNRIGVVGDRAGGHLAALLATTGGISDLDDAGPKTVSDTVQAACVISAPFDLSKLRKLPQDRGPIVLDPDDPRASPRQLIGGKLFDNPEKVARANPTTYISADDPPFLIVHGDGDQEVPLEQAEAFQQALVAAGVKATLHVAPTNSVRLWNGGADTFPPEVFEQIGDFFDRTLKSPAAEIKAVEKQ